MDTLLYDACAVNPTLAAALNATVSQQSKGTKALKQACQQLLDYVATHPHAAIGFLASNKILANHTNSYYLSKPNATTQIWTIKQSLASPPSSNMSWLQPLKQYLPPFTMVANTA